MLRIGAKISLIIRWVLLVDLPGDFVALQAATLNQGTKNPASTL
jgi:hypothetical protein